jgi:peptide/nickel transport system substrate-binding protein
MKRRTPLAIAVALVLSTTACGGGSGSSGTDKKSETLTIAVGADIDTFDPQAQVSASVMQRLQQVVESLTLIDPDGNLQPLLATKWEAAADGMSWTFTLRENVKFSDGEPFNADAVKFSLDRINSPATLKARPDALGIIKSTEVVDPTHVKINLKSPYPAIPRAVSLPVGGIISPKATRTAPNSVEQVVAPVGTGPYVFKENVKSDHLALTSNPNYWGKKPTFKTQIWKVVPEATSRLALLKSKGADVILDPPASNLASLQKDSSVSVTLINATNAVSLYFKNNSKHAPQLSNPEVRRALSYAINRDQIIKVLAFGAAAPLNSPVPPWVFGSCDAGNYGYDPAKAKQLLADAGATNLSIRMVAPNGRYLNDYKIGEAVAGDLRAVGVNVTLANPTDFPTYLNTIYTAPEQSQVDAYIIGLGSVFLDGGHAIRSYMTQNVPPGGFNGAYYSNKEFDALMSKVDQEGNEATRKGLICDALKILVKDAVGVYMYGLRVPVVSSSNLTGLTGNPAGLVNTSWVEPK